MDDGVRYSGVVVNVEKIIHLWNIQISPAAVDAGAIINNHPHPLVPRGPGARSPLGVEIVFIPFCIIRYNTL